MVCVTLSLVEVLILVTPLPALPTLLLSPSQVELSKCSEDYFIIGLLPFLLCYSTFTSLWKQVADNIEKYR